MSTLVNDVTTSQNRAILNHLSNIGPITSTQAIEQYGCHRLAARINNLRESGVKIQTAMIQFVNRNGHRGRYAMYSLVKEN